MHTLRATIVRWGLRLSASRPPEPARLFRIVNRTRGVELAQAAEVADTGASRSKGLLGRKGLAAGEALWIVPCESVHTIGMQFALDLVYLDRLNRIVKIRRNVPPWRLSACLRAYSVIEFPSGAIQKENANPGDQLAFSAIQPPEARPTGSIE